MPDENRRNAPPPEPPRLPHILESLFENLPASCAGKYLGDQTVCKVFDEALVRMIQQLERARDRDRLRLERILGSWKTASRRALERAAVRGDSAP